MAVIVVSRPLPSNPPFPSTLDSVNKNYRERIVLRIGREEKAVDAPNRLQKTFFVGCLFGPVNRKAKRSHACVHFANNSSFGLHQKSDFGLVIKVV